MIADVSKWRLPDLQPYRLYPQLGFDARLPWSKNVNEERDLPLQVNFGAMNTRYYTMTNVGRWLEYHFLLNPESIKFLFGCGGQSDPIQIKENLSLFTAAVNGKKFDGIGGGSVGTHSCRKLAVNTARGNGYSNVCCCLLIYYSTMIQT